MHIVRAVGFALAAGPLALIACGGGTEPGHDDDGGATPPPAVRDEAAPLLDGLVLAWDDSDRTEPGSRIFLPGDTLNFEVAALDSSHLEWIGYRLSIPGYPDYRDSLQVPDSLSREALGVLVSLLPSSPPLSAVLTVAGFARDSAGNLREMVLRGSPASLVTATETLYPQMGGGGGDFAMDLEGAGGRIRTYWVDLDMQAIGRDDGSPSTGLTLPAPARSIDVTLDPNVVVVTLPTLDALALVDMRPESYAITLVPDTVSAVEGAPWLVRVAANGHAIVYRQDPANVGAPGSYVDVDLATGEQRLIADVTVGGEMQRSADRSRIVVRGGTLAQAYTSQTGQFSPPATVGELGTGMSLDARGTLMLLGDRLYDLPGMTLRTRFALPGASGPSALSPDGTTLFAGLRDHVLRVRVQDGAGYDLFPVTNPLLVATPDGRQIMMPATNGYGQGGYFRRYIDLPPLPDRPSSAGALDAARASPGTERSAPRPQSVMTLRRRGR